MDSFKVVNDLNVDCLFEGHLRLTNLVHLILRPLVHVVGHFRPGHKVVDPAHRHQFPESVVLLFGPAALELFGLVLLLVAREAEKGGALFAGGVSG